MTVEIVASNVDTVEVDQKSLSMFSRAKVLLETSNVKQKVLRTSEQNQISDSIEQSNTSPYESRHLQSVPSATAQKFAHS